VSGDLTIVWIVIGFFGMIIALRVFFGLRRENKRREELTAAAGSMGARFEAKPDSRFAGEVRDQFFVFRFFRKRCVTNLIERSVADATFRLFDYAYYHVGSRAPTFWTVLLVSSPRLDLPKFMMGDKGGALRLRDKLKAEPIKFPDKAFCDAHQVHAEDSAAVAALFTGNLQSYLALRLELGMEGAGGQFLVFVPDRIVSPEDVRIRMEEAEAILKELRQG